MKKKSKILLLILLLLSGTVSGKFVQDDLKPFTDATYDLGALAFQWKDLFLSGTLDFGTNTMADGQMNGDWDFNSGNFTEVGNITGTDLDIAAGTGDYSSSGLMGCGTITAVSPSAVQTLQNNLASNGSQNNLLDIVRDVGATSQAGDGSSIRFSMIDTATGGRFNLAKIKYETEASSGRDGMMSLMTANNNVLISGLDIDSNQDVFILQDLDVAGVVTGGTYNGATLNSFTLAFGGGPPATISTLAGSALILSPATTLNISSIARFDDSIHFQEITTPTAIPNYGAIYTKANNELFFQDGAGNEHLLHGDAFSNLWFHSVNTDTVAIATQGVFVVIDSFENVGEQDDLGNVVGNALNNDFTIGTNGAGEYTFTFHTSISSASAASEMLVAMGITLNTPIDVTGATNATPIVVTSVAHGKLNGDMVTIVGATTNTAANGDWVVTAKTADTFTLVDLQGNNSVGNGVYDASSGDVTIVYPGNALIHREVGFGALGVGGANAGERLAVGDKVKLYVANLDSTRDLLVAIVNMEIDRIGD